MSAYVVSREHIDYLVTAGLDLVVGYRRHLGPMSWYHPQPTRQTPITELQHMRHELRFGDEAHRVGQLLVDENVRSVLHRYPDCMDGGSVPGPCDEYWKGEYRFSRSTRSLDPVAVLKAVHGYRYQACEHDGWEVSEAHAFCEALEALAIQSLPGYDEADWEVTV